MGRDWVAWHDDYEKPGSSLGRRLAVVRDQVRRALAARGGLVGVRLLSICAGDGRDVLPVLAAQEGGRSVRALLIELDPELSRRGREAATGLELSLVEVRTADAGATATYTEVEPADLLLACGVFGNIAPGDVRRTVAALPALAKPGATVIWTRGRGDGPEDASAEVRSCFAAEGFAELAFVAPADARFRVGVGRRPEGGAAGLPAGPRLFTFR